MFKVVKFIYYPFNLQPQKIAPSKKAVGLQLYQLTPSVVPDICVNQHGYVRVLHTVIKVHLQVYFNLSLVLL